MAANHSTSRVDARPRLIQMTRRTGNCSRSKWVNTCGFSTRAQGPCRLYGVFSRRRNEKTPCSRVAEAAGTGPRIGRATALRCKGGKHWRFSHGGRGASRVVGGFPGGKKGKAAFSRGGGGAGPGP